MRPRYRGSRGSGELTSLTYRSRAVEPMSVGQLRALERAAQVRGQVAARGWMRVLRQGQLVTGGPEDDLDDREEHDPDGDGLRTAAAARHQDRFEMPRWSSKSRKTRIDASSSAPTEPVDSSS